nr:hypothetical protein [Tanacetum cinerariifolium]
MMMIRKDPLLDQKRRREGGEPESARAPLEPATRSAGRSTTGSKSRQASASESAFAEEPVQTTSQGLKDKKKEVSMHQLALYLKRKPRVQADLPQGLNLDKCLPFYGYAVNRESARDVYSKRRIIAVTTLQIMEWHDYKHLDWISVRRDDDQIYKFK